jgi:hypothetical protein
VGSTTIGGTWEGAIRGGPAGTTTDDTPAGGIRGGPTGSKGGGPGGGALGGGPPTGAGTVLAAAGAVLTGDPHDGQKRALALRVDRQFTHRGVRSTSVPHDGQNRAASGTS